MRTSESVVVERFLIKKRGDERLLCATRKREKVQVSSTVRKGEKQTINP